MKENSGSKNFQNKSYFKLSYLHLVLEDQANKIKLEIKKYKRLKTENK